MGVLSCMRSDCESIMCDTYVDGVGYVCNDCQEEFKLYLHAFGLTPTNENSMKKSLDNFLETEKCEFNEDGVMDVDEFFRKYNRNYEE